MKMTYLVAAGLLAVIAISCAFEPAAAAALSDPHTFFAMTVMPAAGGFGRKDAGGGDDMTTTEIVAEIKRLQSDTKTFAEDVLKQVKAGSDINTELKAKAEEALTKGNDLKSALTARMDELEQKLARKGSTGPDEVKSAGQIVSGSDEWKKFVADRGRGKVSIEVKALNSLTSAAGGALVQEQRIAGIVAPPERRMTVRDLLTPGRTTSNAIQFVQETGFVNNAAPVSEGMQKPESNITFGLETTAVATIAHWIHASKQILDDAPMLESYVDGRLRYGLAYREELQLLKGDGTGVNLNGIIPQATDYNPAFTPAHLSYIDVLLLAALQAELAEYPATGFVLHPTDWTRIQLTKDENGRYIIANPASNTSKQLWSLPVVTTPAMDVGEFLTGAFRLGAQIFDREDANVMISDEDRDNFIKNMLTIRAEERLALAVYRPEAFITGDFPAISG